MFKTFKCGNRIDFFVLIILFLVIRVCFEFRASNFEFYTIRLKIPQLNQRIESLRRIITMVNNHG
jgi:hypothetical protein